MIRFIKKDKIDSLDVNFGGCGIVAVLIADKIGATRFAWCSYYHEEYPDSNEAPSHMLVEKSGTLVDIDGSHLKSDITSQYGNIFYIDRDEVLLCISEGWWNERFDRRDSNRIAKMMKVKIANDLKIAIKNKYHGDSDD